MSDSIVPGLRTTGVLLVLAPLLEVIEQSISPLDGSSTGKDLVGIAAHQGRFELSVVLGVLATMMFAAGFFGLAAACAPVVPRLSRVAGWVAVASMGGFMGVRMGQALELAGVQEHLDTRTFAAAIDHTASNPIGGLVFGVFLLGGLVGSILLAVVAWRAGLPKVACALLGCFQVVDLALPPRPPYSHLILLVALGWIASALWRRATSSTRTAADEDMEAGRIAVR